MDRQEIIDFYFSFKGRIGSQDFILKLVVPFLILSICLKFAAIMLIHWTNEPSTFGIWIKTSMLFISVFVISKRLHDINLSAWWQMIFCAPIYLFSFSLALCFQLFRGSEYMLDILRIAFILMKPAILLYIILCIFLMFKRGTIGANKYGDDPLAVKEVINA